MKFYASAKLNLCLDILKKTESGYHEIRTVFYEHEELKNEIEIKEAPFQHNSSTPQGPAGKAYTLLKNLYKPRENLSIKITRNIPPGSGLGGESSNAATILKALNKIWNLRLSIEQLQQHAAEIGMDVPFFLVGGTAIGTHYGEIITPLPNHKLPTEVRIKSILVDDKTTNAYANLDLQKCGKQAEKTEALINAIKNHNLKNIVHNLHNDFETLTATQSGYHLSGSGPSCFKLKLINNL